MSIWRGVAALLLAACAAWGQPADRQEQGRTLLAAGKYSEAEALFREALAAGETSSLWADTGAACFAQMKQVEALEAYTSALKLAESQLGATHLDLLPLLAALARGQQLLGQGKDARALVQRALGIRVQLQGPRHLDVGWELVRLARLAVSQQDWLVAEVNYQSALDVLIERLGRNNLALATVYDSLGGMYRERGQEDRAEKAYRTALALRELQHGPLGPEVAPSLDELGNSLSRQKRYAEAQPVFARAQFIWQMVLGPDHPLLAASMDNLAFVLASQGKYGEAEPLYRRAIGIRERQYTDSLHNAGLVVFAQERVVEAVARYEAARRILEQPPDAPEQGPRTPPGFEPASPLVVENRRPARLERLLKDYAEALEVMGREAEARGIRSRLSTPASKP
jgi:tetratricopeptide (TPR) repeat protein